MITPSVEGTAPARSTAAPYVLGGVLVLFVVLIGYLVAGAMAPREAAEFAPSPIEPRGQAASLVVDTITIDAREPNTWQWFSFGTRSVVASPTAGWDLGFRRFSIIAARGAQDLGIIAFDAVVEVPKASYATTEFGSDTTLAVFDAWYAYSWITHLLEPSDHVYVVETRNGGHAKLTFLSYYCPELEAGCITFRYAYQPNGSGRFQ